MANKYLWGSLFIICGIFLAVLGRKLFKPALFIIAMMIFSGFVLIIFYSTFLSDASKNDISWIVVVVTILLGCVVGFFVTKLARPGAVILCAWGGFICGVLLNSTCLYLAKSVILCWVVNVVFAGVAGVIAWFFFNQAIIIATSLIGAYMTMRGLGLMVGGFPNEYVLISTIESGGIETINPIFYAYLGGIVVMTVVCTVIQWKMFDTLEEEEKHPYDTMA